MISETIVTEERVGQAAEPKQPNARLLDLTYGWASFVAHQEVKYGDVLPSDDLYALYQDAAQITAAENPDRQLDAVRAFVEARIIPLLLEGSRKSVYK